MSDGESSSASSSSSSSSSEGDLAAIKAQFVSKRKEATNERKKRNRELKKKKKKTPETDAPTKKARATTTTANTAKTGQTKEKKPRKQPAITREEQVDTILQDYAYDKLQDLCPGAKITEQSCAILGDAIKAFIDELSARALHFSQETAATATSGDKQKRQVVGHQAAWGSVRTLVPSNMTAAVLKMSIDAIAAARGTQEPTEEAWRIYCSMSDQELKDYVTRKMIDGM